MGSRFTFDSALVMGTVSVCEKPFKTLKNKEH